jgi:hypothetical protein
MVHNRQQTWVTKPTDRFPLVVAFAAAADAAVATYIDTYGGSLLKSTVVGDHQQTRNNT